MIYTKVIEDATKDLDYYYKQLKSYTKQLMERMEKVYKTTKSKLDSVGEEITQTLNDQRSALEKELTEAKKLVQQMEISTSCDKFPQIVCSKLAVTKTRRCKDVINCNGFPKVSFQPNVPYDDMLEVLLSLEKSLGEFSVVRPYTTELRYPRNVSAKAAHEDDYGVVSDQYECWITGMCSLMDGTILFVDHNNSCLKRMLPRKDTVSDMIQFCFLPRDVCVINRRELAVTHRERRRVQIVSLDTEMALTRKFDVDCKCSGIAHHDGKLCIGDWWNTVYVYSVTGEPQGQIGGLDKEGRSLFIDIENLAVSDCGRVLYVAGGPGLTVVDIETACVMRRYREDNLLRAYDVCINGRGSVFVCGVGHGDHGYIVLQLSEGGQRLGWTTTKDDEITVKPHAVCFDRATSRLFVSKYQENDPKRCGWKKGMPKPKMPPYYWWNNDVAVCRLTTQ